MNLLVKLITTVITGLMFIFEGLFKTVGFIVKSLTIKLSVTNKLKLNKLKKDFINTINFYK